MGQEKRRHDRFFVKLPVDLSVGKARSHGETVDVSFGGLFVRTESPPPLRQLVKVELELPPKGHPIQVMAMAVFVEDEKVGQRQRGVGLQLFGLDPTARDRWETFVKHVRSLPKVEKVSEQRATATPVEDEPPSWSQVVPEIRIRVRAPEDLERILEREMRKGRMYVRTALYLEGGRKVELQFIHPETGKTFSMFGQVDRKVEKPSFEGLRILLPDAKPEESASFRAFIRERKAPTIDIEDGGLGDLDVLEPVEAI